MTISKTSPKEVEVVRRPSNDDKYHPLLHLLRMLLVEAHRYHLSLPNGVRASHSMSTLFTQLDILWSQLDGDPMQRYEFLRNRLSLVYLWGSGGCNDDFTRCLVNPPMHLSNQFRMNRQRLLNNLKQGQLFVDS